MDLNPETTVSPIGVPALTLPISRDSIHSSWRPGQTACRRASTAFSVTNGWWRNAFGRIGAEMRINDVVVGTVLGLIAGAAPLLAHHSFAAEYDANKPITVTGIVTKVEWMNPHARFYVDVKDADGKVTNWNFELGAIPVLLKQGWRKTSLKEGDQVTVEGLRAKDNSFAASTRKVLLPDGRRVFGGSAAADGAPPNQ
jgi:hypothetical protein